MSLEMFLLCKNFHCLNFCASQTLLPYRGYSNIKRMGLLVKEPLRDTMVLLCGSGWECFSPLGGTNS